jgi:hypothetical protein
MIESRGDAGIMQAQFVQFGQVRLRSLRVITRCEPRNGSGARRRKDLPAITKELPHDVPLPPVIPFDARSRLIPESDMSGFRAPPLSIANCFN